MATMKYVVNIGDVFGRLTVLSYAGLKGKSNSMPYYNCKCSCGTEKCILKYSLIKGKAVSCGCYRVEVTSERWGTHRASGTKLYWIYDQIKRRCTDPKSKAYHRYGGAGITMDSEWLESFENFRRDMEDGYEQGLSVDRINPREGYSKSNCRWATNEEQARNKINFKPNNTGEVGISFRRGAYVARYVNNEGVRKSKSFSAELYGDEALALAVAWREARLVECGYSPYHGRK